MLQSAEVSCMYCGKEHEITLKPNTELTNFSVPCYECWVDFDEEDDVEFRYIM